MDSSDVVRGRRERARRVRQEWRALPDHRRRRRASGSVFSLTPPRSPGGAWTSRTLHKFVSEEVNSPLAGVVIGQGGVLYGTGTRGKSDYSPGGVFSLTPPSASGQPWTYTGVVAFTNAEGRDPVVPLIWNNG